jgi:hypothetical protein
LVPGDGVINWHSSKAELDQQKQSMLRKTYEWALALRKLNDIPGFNDSLDPSIGQQFTAITLKAAQHVLSGGNLTDEEKAALKPTMAFSWLTVDGYLKITQSMGPVWLPIDWQFPDNASPEDKRDYVLKEIQFVAARLKPRVLEFDKVHKDAAQNGAIDEFKDWCWQYGLLLNLLSELVPDTRWIDGKNYSVHH